MFGFHCDEEPAIRAQNFRVDLDDISSTSAVFYWDAVDRDPLLVHGIFRGYQVSRRHVLQKLILAKNTSFELKLLFYAFLPNVVA